MKFCAKMILNDYCVMVPWPGSERCYIYKQAEATFLSSGALTCPNIHHVVESILPLNDINHQFGKPNAVLSHIRIYGDRLHHVVHQEEALRVLQDSLRQVLVRAVITQRPTLNMEDWTSAPVFSPHTSSPRPNPETLLWFQPATPWWLFEEAGLCEGAQAQAPSLGNG